MGSEMCIRDSAYSKEIRNKFRRSNMRKFNVIFLCEVLTSGLRETDTCYVTENEAGVKLRVLIIGNMNEYNTMDMSKESSTRIHVPDFKEILEYRATNAVRKIFKNVVDADVD